MARQKGFRVIDSTRYELELLVGRVSTVGIAGNQVPFNVVQDMSQILGVRTIESLGITQLQWFTGFLHEVAACRPTVIRERDQHSLQSSSPGASKIRAFRLALNPSQDWRKIGLLLRAQLLRRLAHVREIEMEEITKAVLEAAGEGATERPVTAIPSVSVAVPASLHASLMARLDRLGSAKDVAQIGAVIGREFSHAVLAAVTSKPEAELQSALDRLIAAGLLFRQGVPPHATYLFKHALVQDAAYGTLLREPRRVTHARIAETLRTQFAEIAENQPELLGRHFSEAGLLYQAIGYLQMAGERAVKRSANREAVTHFRKAKELLEALPDSLAR
jgi:hypothetical protein